VAKARREKIRFCSGVRIVEANQVNRREGKELKKGNELRKCAVPGVG